MPIFLDLFLKILLVINQADRIYLYKFIVKYALSKIDLFNDAVYQLSNIFNNLQCNYGLSHIHTFSLIYELLKLS